MQGIRPCVAPSAFESLVCSLRLERPVSLQVIIRLAPLYTHLFLRHHSAAVVRHHFGETTTRLFLPGQANNTLHSIVRRH